MIRLRNLIFKRSNSIFQIAKKATENKRDNVDNQVARFIKYVDQRDLKLVFGNISNLKQGKPEFYLDCLKIALEKFPKLSLKNDIQLIKVQFEQYESLVNGGLKVSNEIIKLFLIAILHSYTLASAIFKPSIMDYFAYIQERYKVDLEFSLDEYLMEALGEICFKKKIPFKEVKMDKVPIDPFLDEYGGITFKNLCEYITTKFEWKRPIPGSIVDFYDSLTDEKEEFMDDYLKFNKIKQMNVELYQNSRMAVKPKYLSKKLNNRIWIDQAVQYITHDLTSEERRVIEKFQFYFNENNIGSILSLMINDLLTTSLDGIKFTTYRDRMTYALPKHDLFNHISKESFAKLIYTMTEILIKSCKINLTQSQLDEAPDFENSVFSKQFKFTKGQKHLYIKLHPYLIEKLAIQNQAHSHQLPMLCPPKPWTTPTDGGYLHGSEMISSFDLLQKQIYQEKSAVGDLDNAYTFIDQIGQTGWVINQDMLNVFNELMKLPQGFLEIPPINEYLVKTKREKELDQHRKVLEIVNTMANTFAKNGDILYHCYVYDFRGRVYTKSCLTHYGSDLTRSLFNFWNCEPLGDDGWYWIKYQLSTAYGNKSNSNEFYQENLTNVLNSANDFLNCTWWTKGDDPFSTLAVCFEIKKILQFVNEGHQLKDFKSRLPVHQDGSCNGLQHYAALARDENGGKAVNLLPSTIKEDVYSEVQELVKQKLILDNSPLGDFFIQILNRKLVKRPVMTTVYGVTLRGASIHILDEIKEVIQQHENLNKSIHEQDVIDKMRKLNLSQTSYLARIILDSIDELFFNARKIENWLVQNVSRMLTSCNLDTLQYLLDKSPEKIDLDNLTSFSPIMWNTPVNFPVVQIYRKLPQQSYLGNVFEYTHKLYPMDKQRHRNGIAPNFIHSLDAAHLSMTCNETRDITFASIHDCYWTHANKVEHLSKVIREKFVQLHKMVILEMTRSDFQAQMKQSYQYVYFQKSDYPELYQKIKLLRQSYPEQRKFHRLIYELEQMGIQKDQHMIAQLLKQYQPKLYHKQSSSTYCEYDTGYETKSLRGKFGVFVPVKISKIPEKGFLDINQVLKSRYFFS